MNIIKIGAINKLVKCQFWCSGSERIRGSAMWGSPLSGVSLNHPLIDADWWWLEHDFYFSIYWKSSSQLTFIFFRGILSTTNQDGFSFLNHPLLGSALGVTPHDYGKTFRYVRNKRGHDTCHVDVFKNEVFKLLPPKRQVYNFYDQTLWQMIITIVKRMN